VRVGPPRGGVYSSHGVVNLHREPKTADGQADPRSSVKTSFARFMAGVGVVGGVVTLGAGLWAPGAVGAASSNGITSMQPNQILTTALNAMRAATSVTISGGIRQGGQTLVLNVTVSTSGMGRGTVSINGQVVNVASTGTTVYLKASSAFWRSNGVPASALNQLSGRWISLSLSDPGASSISSALNIGNFINQLPKSSDVGTSLVKVAKGFLNGQPVVRLKATNPQKLNDNGVIYVATTGTPYVVRIAGSSGSSLGVINFSHYNQPVNIRPPSGAISISQLEQQG
jgi:hypothetical protein